MSRRWPAGLLALSVVLALASTGRCKPPDLPSYQKVIVLPEAAEVASDPALLKAFGLFNNYPIQTLSADDFLDPSAPCGEEASDADLPEATGRATDAETPSPGHWRMLIEVTPLGNSACQDCGVVKGLQMLHEARAALLKAHELKHQGDFAAAAKCVEQARASLAGTAYAAWIDDTLKAAASHYARLEAMQQSRSKNETDAEHYLFEERHCLEAQHPAKHRPEASENGAEESPECCCALQEYFDAWKAACLRELTQAHQACAASPSVIVVEAHPAKWCGSCWVGRVFEAARRPHAHCSENTGTGCGLFWRVARAPRPEAIIVNGSACHPKSCCTMAAHFQGVPLISALDYVRATSGCRVVIDFEGLQRAGVSPVQPVCVDAVGMPLYSALDLMLRPHRLQATVHGDVIEITCTAECRVVTGGTEPTSATTAAADACPRCAVLHARAVKAEMASRERMAKKIMVEGLMKACYLSLMQGRLDKAAALCREAHALDAARVESDPLVIKTGLLDLCPAVKVGAAANGPVCPAGTEEAEEAPEGQSRLVPHLPGPFADVVEALDALAGQAETPRSCFLQPPNWPDLPCRPAADAA